MSNSETLLAPKSMKHQEGLRALQQCRELGRWRRGCPTSSVVMKVTTIIRSHNQDQEGGEKKSPDLSLPTPPSGLLLVTPLTNLN